MSAAPSSVHQTVEIPVRGMDCAHCVQTVERAIDAVPGVDSVSVLLAAEKAIVTLDPSRTNRDDIRRAVERSGYISPEKALPSAGDSPSNEREPTPDTTTRSVLVIFGLVVALVLFVVVIGEGLGLFERLTDRVPFPIGVAIVAAFGYPVFRNVIRATLQRRVISHTLMTVGVIAALVVGQWATAAIVVFFMRVGDVAEGFTTDRSRRAVRDLLDLAPQTARVELDGNERSVPVAEVRVGETVVVRPGEMIPVDGEVIEGQASVDQAAITGESVPVDAHPGTRVFAASHAAMGSLRIRVTGVGADTTFGRVIDLVEHAEANRADVQRVADRFATWFLPVVGTIAGLTFLLSRDPLATAAVLVVACSCSLALATPVAMLATVGSAARRGLVIKGGRSIELLAQADVLLVDKTGTLTVGRPELTDVIPVGSMSERALLALVASVERDAEHPLAETIRTAASARGLPLSRVRDFATVPGQGVRGTVDGAAIAVGNRRMIPSASGSSIGDDLERRGRTTLFVSRNDRLIGVLGTSDTLRPGVREALDRLRAGNIRHVELLTGDNDRVGSALAAELGIGYQAELLPEDKIAVVRRYQALGRRVVMVGDGVNDAPALAQADVGIAMGGAGSDIAIEAAHIVLMREDWSLVPDALFTARRTMGVVRMNLGFTAAYNVIGLSLAAFGLLPPVFAAAAQSLPDIGILANSTRLLRAPRAPR